MRGVLFAVLGVGCGFDLQPVTGGVESDAAVAHDDADAPPIAPTECGGKVWFADFSGDPTSYDHNGDGTNDWALRDDSPFPTAQLVDGEWSTPGASPQPLDTRPAQTFPRRTIVNVRMQSTSTSGARGAVFWINFGHDGTSHVALFVDVKRTSDTAQQIQFINKVGTVYNVFASSSGLPLGPVDVMLDIDPNILAATYAGGGSVGTVTLDRNPGGAATGSWATLTAYSGAAAFDRVRVELCP